MERKFLFRRRYSVISESTSLVDHDSVYPAVKFSIQGDTQTAFCYRLTDLELLGGGDLAKGINRVTKEISKVGFSEHTRPFQSEIESKLD
jgi:hypothetical protein